METKENNSGNFVSLIACKILLFIKLTALCNYWSTQMDKQIRWIFLLNPHIKEICVKKKTVKSSYQRDL